MKTYRRRFRDRPPQRGRGVESVMNTINSTPIEPVIVNPESKFVVVTYWWGRNNVNANLQRPCPEDIMDLVRKRIYTEQAQSDPEISQAFAREEELENERWERENYELTVEETAEFLALRKKLREYNRALFARDDIKAQVVARRGEEIARLTAAGQFTPGRTYAQMIEHWEQTMRAANCNYLAANTEFPGGRDDYQYGINGKPVFIKRVLDALKDRGLAVLYIDGDMDIHSYPHIFDIEGVDFMARGWEIDPRDDPGYVGDGAHFNPYVFQTSGGTMYFGNTEAARRILDRWIEISAMPIHAGKADDRLLSMAYTAERMVLGTNIIQLPIEYLWLTDKYAKRFQPPHEDAKRSESIIEHAACLTGEERALEGTTFTDRHPEGYQFLDEALSIARDVPGGVLYEYIYFATPEMAEGMRPWLDYLKTAVSKFGPTKGFAVVPYDENFGQYNEIAEANTSQAKSVTINSSGPIVALERNTPIHVILACLSRGISVNLGGMPDSVIEGLAPEIDFAGINRTGLMDMKTYIASVEIETNAPMFLRPGNPVLLHLIRMCKTLEDINLHVKGSYMFLSRIRWRLIPAVIMVKKPAALFEQPVMRKIKK